MSQFEMIERMMHRDTEAFLEMSEKYSWAVYRRIKEKTKDTEEIEKIYRQTMDGFYRELYRSETPDAVKAMLLMYTDKVIGESQKSEPVFPQKPQNPKKLPEPQYSFDFMKRKKGRVRRAILTVLLILGIGAALWVIAGLLMDIGWLPKFNLGYEWFNANIYPCF